MKRIRDLAPAKRARVATARKSDAHRRTSPKKTRRNPDALEAAAELSEKFHGRPAKKVTVYAEDELEHAAVAELGKLITLRVESPAGAVDLDFTGSGGVKVCATPDGQNIVFVGGDQELDLDSLGIETSKDQLPIGECTHIVYATKKAFHNFEPTDYVHEFGEESGERPLLGYSPLNKRLYLEGGRYEVRPEGIVD